VVEEVAKYATANHLFRRVLANRLAFETQGVTKLTTTFSLAKLQEVSAPPGIAQAVGRAPHSAGAKSAASSTRGASDRTVDRAEPAL
jgi:hypothetical protein